ncbi:hypothetical protein CLV35_0084 [Motilibacter peucedani]|uniref:DUF2567 domain-containing protein n=1 Tax=Motilibacter peucedani TaxID=598650 RepID=A0A420XVE9_9ACTN|nr:DUF2567 domain-containing protein [Motilibacter peucedani]RKS84267.1 hypothetical protein CLV35_0084 [Motilibacter peucedani]
MADATATYAHRQPRPRVALLLDAVRRGGTGGRGSSVPTALGAAAGSALVGVAAAFAWNQLAPHLEGTVAGPRAVNGTFESTGAYFGAEAWFMGITVVSGVLCALVTFAVAGTRRAGGLDGLAGLVVGGLLGSLVAWRVGYLLGPHRFSADDVGHHVRVGLDVHSHGALLLWAIAATVVQVALTVGLGVDDHESPPPDAP